MTNVEIRMTNLIGIRRSHSDSGPFRFGNTEAQRNTREIPLSVFLCASVSQTFDFFAARKDFKYSPTELITSLRFPNQTQTTITIHHGDTESTERK